MIENMFSGQLRTPFVAECTRKRNIGSYVPMAKCVLSRVWVLLKEMHRGERMKCLVRSRTSQIASAQRKSVNYCRATYKKVKPGSKRPNASPTSATGYGTLRAIA